MATRRNEQGQVVAEFAIISLVLVLIVAFAVDFGVANAQRSRMTQIIQQAEAECALPATAWKVKNSTNPGHVMTTALIDTLREDGFTGEITAYYYEPTKAELGFTDAYWNTHRIYIYGVYAQGHAQTMFSIGTGAMLMPINVRTWEHSVSYSNERTWRPSDSGVQPDNGYMHVGDGEPSSVGVWTNVMSLNESVMPGGNAAKDEAITEAMKH